MSKRLARLAVFIPLFFVAGSGWAQETPQEVTVCDLSKHPKPFDGEMIRVRGTLNVNFEDFTLSVKGCDTQQGIWLAFGGDVPGIVPSTVNDNARTPGADIKVNGVSYGIKKDENLRRLYALIAARRGDKPEFRVTATLTGAFFAGKENKLPSGQSTFMGYGHLGCCALFVITRVSDVESVPPANLNLRGTVLGPDGRPLEGFVVVDDVVGGSPPQRQQTTTNAKGEFEFSDSGQLLRFENLNYRPLALAVEPGTTPVNVRLEDTKRSGWVIPSCRQVNGSANRVGFSVLFALPKTLEPSPFNDGDTHAYFIIPRGREPYEAELVITTRSDQTAEPDVSYDLSPSEERSIRDRAGAVVGIDSRGRLKNGKRWRTAIFFHDSAAYTLLPREQTSLFNEIIDSACIAKP